MYPFKTTLKSVPMDTDFRIVAITLLYLIQAYLAVVIPEQAGQKTALMVKQVISNRPDPIKHCGESFWTFVLDSNALIDRSMFIKEILEHSERRIVIACPPKWSKSINLDMFKTFVEMEIDKSTNQAIPPNQTFAYNLFKYGKALNGLQNEDFKTPFLISKHPKVIDDHLGRYPVVYIDFKAIRGFNDLEAFYSISQLVKHVYKQHTYLTDVLRRICENATDEPIVDRDKAKAYLNHFNRVLNRTEHDQESLKRSLNLLCKLLFRHHGKRVIVLMDDYDVPFYKLKHLNYAPQSDVKQVMKYLESTLDPILTENHLFVERVVIFGTHAITDVLGPEGLVIPYYTPVNNPWIDYFGITEHEQQQVCRYFDNTLRRCYVAAQWYLGFKTDVNHRLNLGPPYSTAKFLELKLAKIYLPHDHFQNKYFYNFTAVKPLREVIESLVNNFNQTVETNDLRFTKNEISLLRRIVLGHPLPINRTTVNLMLSYLCASGFLTFVKPDSAAKTAHAWIPNVETMVEICRKLKSRYQILYGIEFEFVDKFVTNIGQYVLSNSETETMPSHRTLISLNHLFLNIKHQTGTDAAYYHDLMYAMLNYISIKLRSWMQFETTVWKEGDPPVSYMVAVMRNRGALFAFAFDQFPQDLISLAQKQRPRFGPHRYLGSRKFIAVALDKNNVASLLTDRDYMFDYAVPDV